MCVDKGHIADWFGFCIICKICAPLQYGLKTPSHGWVSCVMSLIPDFDILFYWWLGLGILRPQARCHPALYHCCKLRKLTGWNHSFWQVIGESSCCLKFRYTYMARCLICRHWAISNKFSIYRCPVNFSSVLFTCINFHWFRCYPAGLRLWILIEWQWLSLPSVDWISLMAWIKLKWRQLIW